jgi:hypothetical protein
MKLQYPVRAAVSLLAAVSLFAPGALADHDPTPLEQAMGADVFSRSIFASTYVTLSASTTVYGDVTAGAAATVGANAAVRGSTEAGAATTLGAAVRVDGSVYSGAATTLGATSWVDGRVDSGAATTIGAGATINLRQKAVEDGGGDFYATPLTASLQGMVDAQAYMDGLEAQAIESTIAADMTITPGVYRFGGPAAVSAGTTLTLDALNQEDPVFIFNSSNYITFGAGVNVVVINENTSPYSHVSVIWNVTGTYISLGANANIVGTLLAKSYVSTGANSTAPGGAFSATSYVAVGAGATVGTKCSVDGCDAAAATHEPVPEPVTEPETPKLLVSFSLIRSREDSCRGWECLTEKAKDMGYVPVYGYKEYGFYTEASYQGQGSPFAFASKEVEFSLAGKWVWGFKHGFPGHFIQL